MVTLVDALAQKDPSEGMLEYTGSRGIISATQPFGRLFGNEFPKAVEPSPKLKEKVTREWSEIF